MFGDGADGKVLAQAALWAADSDVVLATVAEALGVGATRRRQSSGGHPERILRRIGVGRLC